VDARAKIFVVTGAETDDDFIAPDPDAVISRPAPESPVEGINGDMFDDSRR
jgi:hypothetical protein